MLYLAQVQNKGIPDKANLVLLACQKAEHAWVVLHEPARKVIEYSWSEGTAPTPNYSDEQLVLAELTDDHQVLSLVSAKDWILTIMQQFLSSGITPEFLRQETERAEQWRQSLTLQSQEVDRRALELEARREQIQELEENLNRQQQSLAQKGASSESVE
jgi:hypothetical protein